MATEKDLILEMQSILQAKMEKDYEKGKTKRDAHPKCTGLLRANFRVLDNIPESLKVGVFQSAGTYPCLIRTSNADGSVQADSRRDLRGFAIKLVGVSGARFTDNELHTQDFILLSHPSMPLGTVKLFRDAVYYSIKWHPLVLVLKFLLSGKGWIIKEVEGAKARQTSPLDINYWSTTPYQCGQTVVKYHIRPTSTIKSELSEVLSPNYLTENMARHLSTEKAGFDFYVQQYVNDEKTPIEDAAVEWTEEHSPFVKIAEIEIPKQNIQTDDRFALAEKLSFSPANALSVHQALGGINRARIQIYKALSDFRHSRDGQKTMEPGLSDFESL